MKNRWQATQKLQAPSSMFLHFNIRKPEDINKLFDKYKEVDDEGYIGVIV
jgi:hypothetical protein